MPAPRSNTAIVPTAFTRRRCLQAGMTGLLGGLAIGRDAGIRAADAGSTRQTATGGQAKNCILIYLLGGPPHLDMWDMKPHAPVEIRGPFQPIATSVPGIDVCEHLPRLAGEMDQLAILRSLSYPNNDHPFMIYHTLTGRVSPVPLGANTVLTPTRQDDPHMGSVVARFKHAAGEVPGYVAIPEVRVRMSPLPVSGGGRAGFLGPRYDPISINDDPREPLPMLKPADDVSSERFGRREGLLAILDGRSPWTRTLQEFDATRLSAVQLVRSTASGGLFDLEDEPAALREQYGKHRFGQSVLLARRLVERGVSFVGIHFNYMTKCDGWDTHKQNFAALQDELLPMLDSGVSALVADLAERGRLDETLMVVMGEFGRSPRINNDAGRDHWGPCASVVFAGGGVRGGRVIGSSDKIAAYPTSSLVEPHDVVATIYHALGIDPETVMHDQTGRPLPVSTGRVITELF